MTVSNNQWARKVFSFLLSKKISDIFDYNPNCNKPLDNTHKP